MKTCRPPRWEPCRCTKWHHPTQGRQRLSEEWSVHLQTFCAEPLHSAPKLAARLCSLLRPRQQPSVRNRADATMMCLRTPFHHSNEVSSGLPFLMTLDFARCCANIGYKKVRPSFLKKSAFSHASRPASFDASPDKQNKVMKKNSPGYVNYIPGQSFASSSAATSCFCHSTLLESFKVKRTPKSLMATCMPSIVSGMATSNFRSATAECPRHTRTSLTYGKG